MPFEFTIARRYLSSRGKPLFVSFLLYISLLAVATGVFALIFVLSVMNGFENDFRQRILGFRSPITVSYPSGEERNGPDPDDDEKIKKLDPRIKRTSFFVEGEAVVQSESGGTMGVRVRGLPETPREERFGKIYETAPLENQHIFFGEELAATLHVHPDFEEKIRLIFPLGDVGPTGDLIPRIRSFSLTGIFRSGFYEFDSKYVLIPYEEALRLFGGEARSGIEIGLEPFDATDQIVKKIQKNFPSLEVQSWQSQNPKLFAALKLEKLGMMLLLSALLLIASFNIFGLSSLVVMEKKKDMAILRSVGFTQKRLRRIFLSNAAGIGMLGTLMGGLLSLVVILTLKIYPLRLPATYYLQYLPILVNPAEVFAVLAGVPILSVLAAFYPAYQASKPSPVEVLRYE